MAGDIDGGRSGSEEVSEALRELLAVGRRSIAAYRQAEAAALDHRLQAAIACLRRDHERHMEELASVLGEPARAPSLPDGAAEADPVTAAIRAENATGGTLLEAVRRAEAELHDRYRSHLAESFTEPIRTMLMRHRREEEAHVNWLEESRWWSGPSDAPDAPDAEDVPGR